MAEPVESRALLDHYLTLAIGQPGAASLENALRLSSIDVFDRIVMGFELSVPVRVLTDPAINPSCVYLIELEDERSAVFWISTVLPLACVALYRSDEFERFTVLDDSDNRLATLGVLLRQMGIALLDETMCRSNSRYLNDEATKYDTYFEVLFEFDAFPPWEASDPRSGGWRPPNDRGSDLATDREHRSA